MTCTALSTLLHLQWKSLLTFALSRFPSQPNLLHFWSWCVFVTTSESYWIFFYFFKFLMFENLFITMDICRWRYFLVAFREWGRERETSMWERDFNWLSPISTPTGDWTRNLGMCLDPQSNCNLSVKGWYSNHLSHTGQCNEHLFS